MRWYTGGIAEAVATSKAKNAIFVVYIEGQDNSSTKLTSLINNPEVSTKLETDSFVALKLLANTLPHHQFAEIYTNVTVPSLYFIGKVGQPLDIIRDVNHAKELCERIDNVICAHNGTSLHPRIAAGGCSSQLLHNERSASSSHTTTIVNETIPSTDENNPSVHPTDHSSNDQFMMNSSYSVSYNSSKTASQPHTENQSHIAITPKEEQKIDNKPKIDDDDDDDDDALDDESNISIEEMKSQLTDEPASSTCSEFSKKEKLERAKELLEKNREAKGKEEEEAERQKEIDRRRVGQDVQRMKRWQEDQELKEIMEQRKKEIIADKEARERVLAQIAQDKAERASRFRTPAASPLATSSAVQLKPTPSLPPDSTRIQFRLPDGTTHTHVFDNTTTVFEIRAYIQENVPLPFRGFSLATTFPRREFTTETNGMTLLELNIGPTAVLLILPSNNALDVTQQRSSIARLILTLFSPIISIYGYIMGYFRPTRILEQSTSTPNLSSDRNKRRSVDGLNKQGLKRRNTDGNVRRQGNIHRFTEKNDSDDENNTWNGNSTQQM